MRRGFGTLSRARWSALPIVATLSAPRHALACSGPGAIETITRNERLGWALWAATLLAAAALAASPRLRAGGRRRLWPLLVLLLVHPGWWMSGRGGDCGYTLRDGSIVVTAVTVLVGGIVYWRARRGSDGQ